MPDGTALVTGGGSGIGRAIAISLSHNGYRVALAGRRIQPLYETARQVTAAHVIQGDHRREDDAKRMISETLAAFGRLDVLVNNAGAIRRNVPVHEIDVRLWDEQVRSNLRGPFLVARAAIRAMPATGPADRAIVNISSTLAHTAAPGVAAYSAAKAGLLALTRAIAVEYGPMGIRCNAVCPNIVDTPLARVDRPDWDELRPQLTTQYPMRQIGTPEDVAAADTYLASPQASWVTGTVLDVDGGFCAL